MTVTSQDPIKSLRNAIAMTSQGPRSDASNASDASDASDVSDASDTVNA